MSANKKVKTQKARQEDYEEFPNRFGLPLPTLLPNEDPEYESDFIVCINGVFYDTDGTVIDEADVGDATFYDANLGDFAWLPAYEEGDEGDEGDESTTAETAED